MVDQTAAIKEQLAFTTYCGTCTSQAVAVGKPLGVGDADGTLAGVTLRDGSGDAEAEGDTGGVMAVEREADVDGVIEHVEVAEGDTDGVPLADGVGARV